MSAHEHVCIEAEKDNDARCSDRGYHECKCGSRRNYWSQHERWGPTPLVHTGLMPERVNGDYLQARRERAFAEHWVKANNEWGGRQPSILEALVLKGEYDPSHPFGDKRVPAITLIQEHATLVATIIQWLGSNVGFCFLEEALEKAGYKIVERPRAEPEP